MTDKNDGIIYTSDKEEMSLKELLEKIAEWIRYFWSKWLIILVVGLAGGALGLFYSIVKKPVYTAETTFVLEEGGSSGGVLGQLGGLAGLAGIDIESGGGDLFQGDNIMELYKSRNMIEKTLLSHTQINGKDELLIEQYISFNLLREKWHELDNIRFDDRDKKDFTRLQDSILGVIVKEINLSQLSVSRPNKKLSIISVKVSSKDEGFAKNFNEGLVRNVNEFYIQTKTKKSLENLRILQYQTDSVRNILDQAINSSFNIVDATPNLNQTRQILRAPAQRSQFNAEANKAILTQLVQNLELAKLALRKETPLIQVVDVPQYPLGVDKVGKLKSIVIGGLFFGFIGCVFLFVKKIMIDS